LLNYKARLLRNRCQTAARVGNLALVGATAYPLRATGAGVRADLPAFRHARQNVGAGSGSISVWFGKRLSLVVVECRTSL